MTVDPTVREWLIYSGDPKGVTYGPHGERLRAWSERGPERSYAIGLDRDDHRVSVARAWIADRCIVHFRVYSTPSGLARALADACELLELTQGAREPARSQGPYR